MGEFSDKVDSSDHDASESASGPALDSEAEELADEHAAPSDNILLAGQAKKSSSVPDHCHSNQLNKELRVRDNRRKHERSRARQATKAIKMISQQDLVSE